MKIHAEYNYFVYILTNKNRTVLYTGVTNNLKERLFYHCNHEPFSKSFTAKYKCYYLIHFEHFMNIQEAIAREKQIKGKSRAKKEALIGKFNKDWEFLNDNFT
ncbi:MAG: endonuclease [Flavobacteriaceae bacterium]|nr:endonuclease [Flavobacteriaceae bacterium]|tara:strand:- start:68 stop:376 length:309 start_codon:yes stop_codon:yes gene_type:complete